VSLGGVILGHIFAYRWFFLESHHHDGVSVQHGYLPYFIVLSVAVSLLSLAWHARLGYKEKRSGIRPRKQSFWALALSLFILQSIVFIVMESLERLHGGGLHGIIEFFNSPLFMFGMILQLMTAALTALSVSTAAFVGRVIATRLKAPVLKQEITFGRPTENWSFVLWERLGNKGPPAFEVV